MRHTHAIINLQALKNNLSTIKKSIINPEKTGIIAVVKANAYGHGLIPIAKAALEWGVSHLAVALPSEGIELRTAGITAPIIVLGLIAPEEAEQCVKHKLIVTICESAHVQILTQAAKKTGAKAKAMIKVDTGMNRIGTNHDGAIKLAKELANNESIDFHCLFTHFASAGGPDFTYAKMQAEKFSRLVQELEVLGLRPPFITSSASSASLTLPQCQYDLVREGISMYGLYASEYMHQHQELEPVLKLVTNISYLKKVPANTCIGYEMSYKTKEECYIATLPIGYGDGYSRLLSNKGRVLISGEYYPLCGNICMDQMMVCLGAQTNARVGDEVVLIGKQGDREICLEDLAELVGTINYELACNLAQRVPRIYVNN